MRFLKFIAPHFLILLGVAGLLILCYPLGVFASCIWTGYNFHGMMKSREKYLISKAKAEMAREHFELDVIEKYIHLIGFDIAYRYGTDLLPDDEKKLVEDRLDNLLKQCNIPQDHASEIMGMLHNHCWQIAKAHDERIIREHEKLIGESND